MFVRISAPNTPASEVELVIVKASFAWDYAILVIADFRFSHALVARIKSAGDTFAGLAFWFARRRLIDEEVELRLGNDDSAEHAHIGSAINRLVGTRDVCFHPSHLSALIPCR